MFACGPTCALRLEILVLPAGETLSLLTTSSLSCNHILTRRLPSVYSGVGPTASRAPGRAMFICKPGAQTSLPLDSVILFLLPVQNRSFTRPRRITSNGIRSKAKGINGSIAETPIGPIKWRKVKGTSRIAETFFTTE